MRAPRLSAWEMNALLPSIRWGITESLSWRAPRAPSAIAYTAGPKEDIPAPAAPSRKRCSTSSIERVGARSAPTRPNPSCLREVTASPKPEISRSTTAGRSFMRTSRQRDSTASRGTGHRSAKAALSISPWIPGAVFGTTTTKRQLDGKAMRMRMGGGAARDALEGRNLSFSCPGPNE